jgi:carbonic anhydrase
VKAALQSKLHDVQHLSRIQMLVDNIAPGLAGLDPNLPRDQLLAKAIEANVRWSMRQLQQTPEGARALEEGRAKLVGAIYEIATGKVQLLD